MSFDTACFGGGVMNPGMDRDLGGNTLAYGRKHESGAPAVANTKQQRAARLLAVESAWTSAGKVPKRARLHAGRLERLRKIAGQR